MFIITVKNVKKYVQAHRSDLPFSYQKINQVEEITEETYVNWIYRVEFSTKTGPLIVYLRQSRDYVKKKPEYKMPAERIAYEEKILAKLGQIVPGVVPEVVYFDIKNNVLWLADIKQGCPLLVKQLLQGHAHPETGKYFGKVLAIIHGNTFGIRHKEVRGSVKLNQAAVDFHLGMRLAPAIKMFPQATTQLLKQSKRAPTCLVLGDLASKNIFVDGTKIRFLDLERSFIGDPAFDLAFLFCHYLIEVPPNKISSSLAFIRQLIVSYRKNIKPFLSKVERARFENRLIRFVGVTILYRLFGFYLVTAVDPDKEWWKRVAHQLLAEQKSKDLVKSLHQALKVK